MDKRVSKGTDCLGELRVFCLEGTKQMLERHLSIIGRVLEWDRNKRVQPAASSVLISPLSLWSIWWPLLAFSHQLTVPPSMSTSLTAAGEKWETASSRKLESQECGVMHTGGNVILYFKCHDYAEKLSNMGWWGFDRFHPCIFINAAWSDLHQNTDFNALVASNGNCIWTCIQGQPMCFDSN